MWLGNKDCLHQKKETSQIKSKEATESQCEEIIIKSALEKAGTEKTRFIHNLADVISQLAFGNINEFSHQVNVWHNTIRILLKGNILPTWEILSKISLFTGVSIFDLLTAPRIEVSKNSEYEKYRSAKKSNTKQPLITYHEGDEKVK
jgi:hypothetical protein